MTSVGFTLAETTCFSLSFFQFFFFILILLPITEYQLRQNILKFYSFSVFNGKENFHRVWRTAWLQIILIFSSGRKLAIGVFCLSEFNNIIRQWCELEPVHSVCISSQLSLEGQATEHTVLLWVLWWRAWQPASSPPPAPGLQISILYMYWGLYT